MPINEPIRNRKVAPASLAFERQGKGLASIAYEVGTVPTNVTYQTDIIVNTTAFFVTEFTDTILANAQREVMVGVANAERRSKASVGEYHRAFMWTSDNSGFNMIKANNLFGALTALQAPTEVIAGDGCRTVQSTPSPNTAWMFRVPDGSEGVWWMYAHTEIRVVHADDLQIARLCLYKNGVLWSVVDVTNADGTKHNDLGVIVLRGGVHVPLQVGDRVQWSVALSSGTPGGLSLADGTCYYAVINGHRESCEYREVNAPTTGNTFNASLH